MPSASVQDALQQDDMLHVRILQTDALVITERWASADVCSSYWRLYLNHEDGAWVELDVGSHRLIPGAVHLIPSWVRFTCRNRNPVRHFYVHFELLGLPGAVVREVFPRPLLVGLTPPQIAAGYELGHRVGTLGASGATNPDLRCAVKALIFASLGHAFAHLAPGAQQRCRQFMAGNQPLAPILQFIEDHLPDALPNALLARVAGLAEDHFIRRFREQVGQTPAQYVQERRLAAAAQRLRFTTEPIDQVAEACGFLNRHYLTRIFTRRLGLGPAAYRKQEHV